MAKDRINEMRHFLNMVDVPAIGGDPIGLREKPKENLHEGKDSWIAHEYISDLRAQLENFRYSVNRNDYVNDNESLREDNAIIGCINKAIQELRKAEKAAYKDKNVKIWI